MTCRTALSLCSLKFSKQDIIFICSDLSGHVGGDADGYCGMGFGTSSSCHQTSVFHLSTHFFAVSLNLLRSSNEQGCSRRVHYIMCAVFSVARPHSQVVSPS